ncbi:MAG: hypothetical protein EA397_05675 [Deltaproteobacteria bacterium]|nr:MAG: hypothetical protein EA397_05675 [Deltaproteobacteria bacterium]
MRVSLLSLGLLACGGPTAQNAASSAGSAGTTARELPASEPSARAPSVDATPVQAPEPVEAVARLTTVEGRRVLDLTAERWPGRASSPELVIGEHRLTDVQHLTPIVLRVSLPERLSIDPGSEAFVYYGDDPYARVTLPSEEQP